MSLWLAFVFSYFILNINLCTISSYILSIFFLASDCGRGAQHPTAHLGNHSEAGLEQTGVVILCSYPTCLKAFMGISEWVSVSISVTFLVILGRGGEGLPFFFWSRGGLSKNSVWCGGSWDIKKNCPFKKISSAPSAAVYIMNAALAVSRVEP